MRLFEVLFPFPIRVSS